MFQNPESLVKLSESKFSSISKFIAFQTYQKQKQQRKVIETERKNIQLNVANLYRKAKNAAKQLNKTQLELVQKLNRKSSKQKQENLKQQFKRLKQEQLHQLKNNNSLSRYMNMLKREEAKRRLINQNKQMSGYIKQRQNLDEKIKKLKSIQESKNLFERNMALQNGMKANIQLAKTKNMFQKRKLSSIVRSDLVSLQNTRIQREKVTIQDLVQKQKQLTSFFSKAKHQKIKYQSILDLGKNKSFEQLYQVVAAKQQQSSISMKRKKSHKKRKNNSQAKILSSYSGIQRYF